MVLTALVVVMVAAVSACASSGSNSGSGTRPTCYTTVADTSGSAVTVAALGTSDCTSVAQFLGGQFPGTR